MRPHPVESGWAGSLFDEPIDQVKAILTPLQFPETGPFPEERGELVHYAHETWVRFLLNGHLVEEFVSTDRPIGKFSDNMDADMKTVDDARAAAGNLPRARCSVANGIRTYEDPALQEAEQSAPAVESNRIVTGIRMPEYSFATGAKFGEKPEHTEAEAQGDNLCPGCLCRTCDWSQHICKSCEDPAACATRGTHTIACPECSGLKKPSRKALAKAKKQAPTVEHSTLIRYGHETWRQYELEGRLVEEFVSTDRPVSKESEFAADMVAVDAARKAAGDLPLARSFVEKGIRGIRIYEDPELQHRVPRVECTHKLASQGNGGLCAGCSERKGEPCKYSRAVEAEPAVEAPAVEPAKKPAKVKKSKCPDISTDCPERKECALNKFWKWRPCAHQSAEVPAKEPKSVGILRCDECLCLACPHKDLCHKCKDKALCASVHSCTVACPGVTWDCSDCLCPKCANNGASCTDCKGPVYCSKHGGKIGGCPDFRTEEGKEQHCLENGCLCFKCQLIGTDCEQCVGPIRCDKPRMKCKEYVGAEVEA